MPRKTARSGPQRHLGSPQCRQPSTPPLLASRQSKTSLPPRSVRGSSGECRLIGVLIGKGVSEEELRAKPIGHNFVELFKAAKAKGMELVTAQADNLIDWINDWHFNGVKIRYEFTEDRVLPTCEVLIPLAQEIIQKTSLPEPATVDRVSPLNSAGDAREVYSVPIDACAVRYARWIVERLYGQDTRYRFHLKSGGTFTLTGAEILSRTKA
jgi:hypothetical protein